MVLLRTAEGRRTPKTVDGRPELSFADFGAGRQHMRPALVGRKPPGQGEPVPLDRFKFGPEPDHAVVYD